MKLKMLEYFQGTGVSAVLVSTGAVVNVLSPDEVYEVDLTLGSYLLDNRKAEELDAKVKPAVHYGAQAKPELRQDDEKYAQMKAESEPEDEPIMTTKSKRSRK